MNRFRRQFGTRHYKKIFVLSVEGKNTEPQYFELFKTLDKEIKVDCIKRKHGSSPLHVLKRIKEYLRELDFKATDEAWIVIDRDQWDSGQIKKLYLWSQEAPNYHLALSNPKFEYWLLLHFEDGSGVASSEDCTNRLKRYIPEYNKCINRNRFSESMIQDAIRRAKQKDVPPCIDWPKSNGSTVYRLIEAIK